MNLNIISLPEAKLILDASISGRDLLFSTIIELVGVKAIRIVENDHSAGKERYIIEKSERFDDYSSRYYQAFYRSVQENYDSLIDPAKIREPLLTPHYLIEKVYRKCKKSYPVYKDMVKEALKEKNLIELHVFPWQKMKLTTQGTKLKDHLNRQLKDFEELLKEYEEEKLLEKIEDVWILLLLVPNLNKEHLLKLKEMAKKGATNRPNLELGVFLDIIWTVDIGGFNSGFNIFEWWDDR